MGNSPQPPQQQQQQPPKKSTTAGGRPLSLQYPKNPCHYVRGKNAAAVENKPTYTGGKPDLWSIEPELPRGLNIEASTGRIWGSPEIITEEKVYRVTAANTNGAAHVDLKISCIAEPIKSNLLCVAHQERFDEQPKLRALVCNHNHAMCNECFHTYFQSRINNGELPLTCPQSGCRQEYEAADVDLVLSDSERKLYTTKCMELAFSASPRDVMVNCPHCEYIAIYPEGKDPDLVHCDNVKCKKLSCRNCQVVIEMKGQDRKVDGMSQQEIKKANDHNEQLTQTHLIICSLNRRVQDTINKALNVPCPKCGMKGQKDDACNHMTCNKCLTVYCYCCGKERPEAGWSAHNLKWQQDKKLCPQYLHHINTVDAKWPSTAAPALNMFHRERALRHLQKLLHRVPQETLNLLLGTFPAALGGYELADIRNFQERPYFKDRVLAPLC